MATSSVGCDPQAVAPELDDLDALRAAAAACTGCELHEPATQTVFGAGPASAWLMFVGEQPGDREDQAGEPFVGRRAGCWTGRWRRPGSTVPRPT